MPPRLFGFADFSRSALHPEEAAITAEAAQLSADGQSDAAVAAFLAKAGFAGTLGAPFTSQTAGRLLTNPAIAGLKRDADGALVAGWSSGHDPSRAVHGRAGEALGYQAARRRLRLPAHLGRPGGVRPVRRPLGGLRSSTGKPGYSCPEGPRQDRPGRCGRVRIDAGLLEDFVGENILARLLLLYHPCGPGEGPCPARHAAGRGPAPARRYRGVGAGTGGDGGPPGAPGQGLEEGQGRGE